MTNWYQVVTQVSTDMTEAYEYGVRMQLWENLILTGGFFLLLFFLVCFIFWLLER